MLHECLCAFACDCVEKPTGFNLTQRITKNEQQHTQTSNVQHLTLRKHMKTLQNSKRAKTIGEWMQTKKTTQRTPTNKHTHAHTH